MIGHHSRNEVYCEESVVDRDGVEFRLFRVDENGVRKPNVLHLRTNQLDGGILVFRFGEVESGIEPDLQEVDVQGVFLWEKQRNDTGTFIKK